jgi:4,5-dihydroxyphthalate decarboxylase
MADLELSAAFGVNPRTRPLLDGTVVPEALQLLASGIHPSEMFWRQLKFAEFDVSEMSMSSLTVATSKGPTPWVAIPVFTTREFYHLRAIVRVDAGIEKPQDLKGKRVGVPEYQQTAAIWSRGVLQHEFGVHASDMHWFMERPPEQSHGGSTGFTAPEGVKLEYIPRETSMGEMLLEGKLDAALLYLTDANLVDRSRVDLSANPKIRTLFPDPPAEGRRYYKKTGIFPINHTVVIRRTLYEQFPWIALNMFSAFVEAKQLSVKGQLDFMEPYLKLGLVDESAYKALKADPFPYGIKASQTVLETITQYVYEQGIAARKVGLDELFAKSTLDL